MDLIRRFSLLFYTNRDILDLLNPFAELASIALDNARLDSEAQEGRRVADQANATRFALGA